MFYFNDNILGRLTTTLSNYLYIKSCDSTALDKLPSFEYRNIWNKWTCSTDNALISQPMLKKQFKADIRSCYCEVCWHSLQILWVLIKSSCRVLAIIMNFTLFYLLKNKGQLFFLQLVLLLIIVSGISFWIVSPLMVCHPVIQIFSTMKLYCFCFREDEGDNNSYPGLDLSHKWYCILSYHKIVPLSIGFKLAMQFVTWFLN